jgi:hypothetical protein
VAAVSAALVGTIAAVVPSGLAHADVSGATLPDPIAGVCAALDSANCWRYTSLDDIHGTAGALPTADGSVLQLNAANAPGLAAAAWYNTPTDITGKTIEASYTAYLDSLSPPSVGNFAHGDGMAFALIEGELPVTDVGNNQPAPINFPATFDSTKVEYGAGGNGLGFSGFDGNAISGNLDGRKNLGFVLTTSTDDNNDGTDQFSNASLGGLLKGQRWVPTLPADQLPTDQDPHKRAGRWYNTAPTTITNNIFSSTPNGRPVRVGVQLTPVSAGVWHAKMYVDGALLTESDVNLPNVVYFGFTAGSNVQPDFAQRHAVSDVTIKYGTAGPVSVSANPASVNFGSVAVGQPATRNVTLTNNSAVPVNLTATATGGFDVSGFPHQLGSGASVSAPVTFRPQSAVASTGTASIAVAPVDGSSAAPVTISLSGTGSTTIPGAGAPFNALPPTRILDTRKSGGPIGPDSSRNVMVAGVGGVPATAGAVVMNVTVTEPTQPGYITVYPTGTQHPTASNLNFVPGENIANLVTAKIGANGQVSIYNFAGNTDVLFDVVGWFPDMSATATSLSTKAAGGGQFVPLVPARILDTREGNGAPQAPLGPNSSIDLQVTGRGGVPGADQVAAVVMNLTATNTTAPGYLTAWPTGSAKQETSNLNFGPGQNVPDLAVVPISNEGQVSIYNFDGNTDVVADVVGYYTKPGVTVTGGGLFHAMAPDRFLDTRDGTGAPQAPVGPGGTLHLQISNRAPVPADAIGVVMNTTATNTTAPGYLTVYPSDSAQPTTSSLNFVPDQNVPNLVMSKLGGGAVNIFNFAGNTDVVADVVGWYAPS